MKAQPHGDFTDPPAMTVLAEHTLMGSRFVLVPMYLGLSLYMAMYNIAFFGALWGCLVDFTTHPNFREFSEILKLAAIDAVDSVMIANLIVMISCGSYSIFVREIDTEREHLPRFIKGMTSGILKVKIGGSLVGVSAVHLLASFINAKAVGWDVLLKQLVIHLSFILSAWVFARMEVLLHPPEAKEH
jgi:uncharacterized protein (TIGR00645 family)